MSDETIGQPVEGGESLPEVKSVPKSDAEAAEQEAVANPEVQESEKPKPDPEAQDKEEKQRNRTTRYIETLKQRAAQAEARAAELAAKLPQPSQAAKAPVSGEPTLEAFDYDIAAYTRAHADWAVSQALTRREQEQQKQAQESQRREALLKYEEQVQSLLDDHPDFYEVIGTIDPKFVTPELEAAIIAHPNGARLAYHIGTHDDDAFLLASTRPELMAMAVDRLAKRISAAPAPAAPAAPKPITQAPAPPPSLSGKAPVSVPPEKLTDEQWLAREKERARKR